MPKMVNMKIDPKAREEKYSESVAVDRPMYPYGLEIRLDNEALDKLHLSEMPEVGSAMTLIAKVDVTSCAMNESKDGGKNRSLSLQITDLGLSEDADGEAAEKLYGKD